MANEGKNRMIVVFAIIFIIILIALGYFIGGLRGISAIFGFLKWAIIGIVIVGLTVWGVWYLFIRKERDDRVALNVKTIVNQSKLTKPETLANLFISGDVEHPQVRLGKIIGYTRIKNSKGLEEDVFVWKKSMFPFSMFEEPKAIRVNPDQHSEMIGDIIIQGISLVEHGGFFYVNTDHLDVEKVDKTIKSEVLRRFTFDVLRDIKIISDMGIGINPEHQKYLEGKSLLKIPTREQPVATQPSYEETGRGGAGYYGR